MGIIAFEDPGGWAGLRHEEEVTDQPKLGKLIEL